MIPTLTIENLSYSYEGSDHKVLVNVNLQVGSGEIIGVMGPSGSGKSTLGLAIKGIIPYMIGGSLGGSIQIMGRPLASLSLEDRVRQIGMVFQDPMTQLFSSTVEEELAFSLENLCMRPSQIINRVDDMVRKLHLEPYRKKHPNDLSGGWQQVVALGAVLILKPKLLILDEALSWMDSLGKATMKEMLIRLSKEGISILMIAHDPENLSIAHRIKYLDKGILWERS